MVSSQSGSEGGTPDGVCTPSQTGTWGTPVAFLVLCEFFGDSKILPIK